MPLAFCFADHRQAKGALLISTNTHTPKVDTKYRSAVRLSEALGTSRGAEVDNLMASF